jgi:hypothetical protein
LFTCGGQRPRQIREVCSSVTIEANEVRRQFNIMDALKIMHYMAYTQSADDTQVRFNEKHRPPLAQGERMVLRSGYVSIGFGGRTDGVLPVPGYQD